MDYVFWCVSMGGATGGLLCILYRMDDEFGLCTATKVIRVWGFFVLMISVMMCTWMETGGSAYEVATAGGVITVKEAALAKEVAGVRVVGYWILAVYLVLCSVMDYFLKMMCDFFHYIGLAGGCLLLLQGQPSEEILCSLLVFTLLQWKLFLKMYGPADGAGFVICAVVLAAEGKDIQQYLMHMAVTFVILGVVQGGKRNINKQGNLKQPVALLPYITVAFLVIIWRIMVV